jgi:hypothetical protein
MTRYFRDIEQQDQNGDHASISFSAQILLIVPPSSAAKRKEIIDWLSPLNFFARQATIFSDRQEGTGEWLLNNEQFTRWESSVRGVLWCRGIRECLSFLCVLSFNCVSIAGVGKTVLVYDLYLNSEPH